MKEDGRQKSKLSKLLLIEDHEGYARILGKRLSSSPPAAFEIVHAHNLQAGFDCLAQQRFDVILVDLHLPDSQGLETFKRLHAHAPDIPIVILTALDDKHLGLQAVRGGAQDYLIKGQIQASEIPRTLQFAVERYRLRTELQNETFTDELTGLSNRRGFLILAEQQMKVSRRAHKPMLLFFMDIDHFKPMNDSLGHLEGDRLLQALAKILQAAFRDSDVKARIGGDEFVVLAIEAGEESREFLLGRLKKKLAGHNQKADPSMKLSLSIGTGKYDPLNPSSVEDLLKAADQAMYADKRSKL